MPALTVPLAPSPAQQAAIEATLHETIPIALTFEGSYYALARFVHHIEQSEYLVQVRALALQSTGTPDGRLQATLSLSVVTLQPGEVQP